MGFFNNNLSLSGIITFEAVGGKHQHRLSGTFQNHADAKTRVGNPLTLLDFTRSTKLPLLVFFTNNHARVRLKLKLKRVFNRLWKVNLCPADIIKFGLLVENTNIGILELFRIMQTQKVSRISSNSKLLVENTASAFWIFSESRRRKKASR
ncbi:hypothetical protein ESY86_07685 [Subsaximicrobium wynnwilliamsii]|uniref:Uncharacterized protein n=1 Tax=Subsaximicrobium wynnwilliamsii TaxID=291179 RepID=A0A5C6ZIT0_9FLAO|nr:hypothetical protein [Subsaximicrobium wynnwilliamsii]TXD83916.1 hypothetical protein ESY87_07850 [Subsaximicrobium wynnwilliamsii]TXD89656.1 hypothetical protein ESY86_07685 [Subsaximicrobium wynnwilliamsii]TXE01641.1 hypothetical protein ESY88_14750 [Subsaximicrobium wynnwilliamsii]